MEWPARGRLAACTSPQTAAARSKPQVSPDAQALRSHPMPDAGREASSTAPESSSPRGMFCRPQLRTWAGNYHPHNGTLGIPLIPAVSRPLCRTLAAHSAEAGPNESKWSRGDSSQSAEQGARHKATRALAELHKPKLPGRLNDERRPRQRCHRKPMRLCPERHAPQSPWGGNRGPASPISADSAYRNQNVTPSLPWQGSELQACEDHAGCVCGGGGTAATPGLGPPTFKKSSIHSAGRPKISSCKEASPTLTFTTPCGGQGKRHDPAASERSGKSQRLLPNVPDAGAGTRRLWGNGAVYDSSGKSGEPDRPSCRLPADRCLACGEKRTKIWRQQAFGRPLGFPFA